MTRDEIKETMESFAECAEDENGMLLVLSAIDKKLHIVCPGYENFRSLKDAVDVSEMLKTAYRVYKITNTSDMSYADWLRNYAEKLF